ncbi:MarR family winged helix-turn-helix transcriptional regulator [Tundrisphaera sp. TA3]|uniref:MarR family winged helix-turn-helix transcriptional regulator n=1 Tax=Tundrisphaera sp. TA3 TaxID=3435775 RepID=UPI003EB9956B
MVPSDEGVGRDAGALLADLWRLFQAILDDSEPALAELGLSVKAFYLLEAIGDHPYPAQLARKMHLPPPTVTYLVKQLEARGFVERRAEPDDLRRFRLEQTASGREALLRGSDALSRPLGVRLARLAPGDRAAFDRALRRLAEPGDEAGRP